MVSVSPRKVSSLFANVSLGKASLKMNPAGCHGNVPARGSHVLMAWRYSRRKKGYKVLRPSNVNFADTENRASILDAEKCSSVTIINKTRSTSDTC
jgi:hypothetical protein